MSPPRATQTTPPGASGAIGASAGMDAGSTAPFPSLGSEPKVGTGAGPGPKLQGSARKATMMGVAPAPGAGATATAGTSGAPTPSATPAAPATEKLVEREWDSKPAVAKDASQPDLAATAVPSPRETEPGLAPTAKSAGPMFPEDLGSKQDLESTKEPTVMKQAAELLEEALREAGGSIEEIGQNPLFSKSSQRNNAVEEQKPEKTDASAQTEKDKDKDSPAPVEKVPDSTQQSGETLVMAAQPAKNAASPSSPPTSGAGAAAPPRTAAAARSTPPARPVSDALDAPPQKQGPKIGGLVAGLLVVCVLAGVGVYAVKSGAIGGTKTTPTATPTPTPTPTDHANLGAPDGGATASTDAGGAALGAGGDTKADASAAATTAVTVATPPPPPPPPPPPVTPKPAPPPPPPPVTPKPAPPPPPPPPPPPATTPKPKPKPSGLPAPTATDPDFKPPPPPPPPPPEPPEL
jgi:hypothetical protein